MTKVRRLEAPCSIEEGASTYTARTTNGFVVATVYHEDEPRREFNLRLAKRHGGLLHPAARTARYGKGPNVVRWRAAEDDDLGGVLATDVKPMFEMMRED